MPRTLESLVTQTPQAFIAGPVLRSGAWTWSRWFGWRRLPSPHPEVSARRRTPPVLASFGWSGSKWPAGRWCPPWRWCWWTWLLDSWRSVSLPRASRLKTARSAELWWYSGVPGLVSFPSVAAVGCCGWWTVGSGPAAGSPVVRSGGRSIPLSAATEFYDYSRPTRCILHSTTHTSSTRRRSC